MELDELEIKVNEYGFCDVFKVNGETKGENIKNYLVLHIAGEKPKLFTNCIDSIVIKKSEDEEEE